MELPKRKYDSILEGCRHNEHDAGEEVDVVPGLHAMAGLAGEHVDDHQQEDYQQRHPPIAAWVHDEAEPGQGDEQDARYVHLDRNYAYMCKIVQPLLFHI